jgi:hypothetical protein
LTTTPLAGLAKTVKSANAGASWLTVDVVFDDDRSYRHVVDAGVFTEDRIAAIYEVEPALVHVFECPQILTLKATLPRRIMSGSAERDFDGVQQFAPLLELPVPDRSPADHPPAGSAGQTITDPMMDDLRSWLHVVRTARGWNSAATADAVRHFAQGVGDDNPLWWTTEHDTEHPARAAVPPTFLYSCGNGSASPTGKHMHPAESWLPGTQSIWLGDRWVFQRAVRIGEPVSATEELVEISERISERYGRTATIVDRTTYRGTAGEVLATCDKKMLRRPRLGTAATHDRRSTPLGPSTTRYSREEIETIERRYAAEVHLRRGPTPRMIEDVNIGDELPVLLKGPLTLTGIIGWMLGWGSPMALTNRMISIALGARPGARVYHDNGLADTIEATHWDVDLARTAGFAGPYDFGAQRISWAAHLLTDWSGDAGFVRELDARLKRPNVLGDTTYLTGVVTAIDATGPCRTVTCAVTATNQRGEVTLEADAVVELPSRESPPADA